MGGLITGIITVSMMDTMCVDEVHLHVLRMLITEPTTTVEFSVINLITNE